MSEPQTEAGKRLLDVFAPAADAEDEDGGLDPRHAMLLRDILAIEAEAVEPWRKAMKAIHELASIKWATDEGQRGILLVTSEFLADSSLTDTADAR